MPLDAKALDELKANLVFARKRPMAFGLCIGKSPETTVLLNHKTKEPEAVGRLAKQAGETTKLAFGTMLVEGKNLNLSCHGDLIPGMARRTKEMLKFAGLKFKVRILDAEGNVLEENGDEDEEGGGEGGGGGGGSSAAAGMAAAGAEADPQREKWLQVRPRVAEALDKAEAGGADTGAARAVWGNALALAGAGDFAGALQKAAETVRMVTAAPGSGGGGQDEAKRWQETAAKLGPAVEGLGGIATPEARKVAALWKFAQSKATSPAPDFGTALKTAGMMVRLIADIRAAMNPEPEKPATRGAPVTAEENKRLAGLSDEDLMKEDLTLGDPKVLFGKDYMLALKDQKFRGEGSPKLKPLMQAIYKIIPDGDIETKMRELEQVVGPPDWQKLGLDNGRYKVVRKQQEANAAKKKKTDPDEEGVPALAEDSHPKFMASRSQLMFGKVLGDAFGIHEVFGALLSPTGGLVGAGNDSVHLAPDNPIAIHGTVHDAAGYLKSYHGEGPGYNYLGDSIEDLVFDNVDLPDYLAGQISGISFWVKEAGQGQDLSYWIKESLKDIAKQKADEVLLDIEKKLKSTRDKVTAEVNKKIDEGRKKIAEGIDAAEKLKQRAEKKVLEIADAVDDAAEKAKKTAVETVKSVGDKLGKVADGAQKKLAAAWNSLWD